ncbi:heme-binding protein [Myxococcota bacterium]|nr:heme-binding protein [Myxococcota bacterium]
MQGVQDGNAGLITGLQNGFHIFQGAVPIYRGNTLVGAIGVSGDGAEQDDFVPFVALDEVGKNQRRRNVVAAIGNAPGSIRANNISVQNVNLRYVVCPTAPFLTSNEQNGCEGR